MEDSNADNLGTWSIKVAWQHKEYNNLLVNKQQKTWNLQFIQQRMQQRSWGNSMNDKKTQKDSSMK